MATIFEDTIAACNEHVGETVEREAIYQTVYRQHRSWWQDRRQTIRNYMQLLSYAGYVDIMNLTYCKILRTIPNQKIFDFQLEARQRKQQLQNNK